MKKVLVTGGTRGIGRAAVEKFASLGYSVAFIYNKSDQEASVLYDNIGAYPIKADLSDKNAIKKAAKDVVSVLGGVDILINCAGICQIKMFTDIEDEDLERMMNTNFSSAFLLARELAPYMIKAKYGRIINIGSMWGARGASCEVHYSASKAALEGFTKALAKELGPSYITVNCIEPGVIETDMNACLDSETVQEIVDATPLCRLGTPYDVANLAAFLASDDASFITAQCIGVDGGIII